MTIDDLICTIQYKIDIIKKVDYKSSDNNTNILTTMYNEGKVSAFGECIAILEKYKEIKESDK